MNLPTEGHYIQFTDSDADGQYSFVAKVTKVDTTNELIQLEGEHPYGLVSIPFSDSDKLFQVSRDVAIERIHHAKPKNTKSVHHKTKVKDAVEKKVRTKSSAGISKKDRAINLYRGLLVPNQFTPDRARVIALFVDQLDMTTAGASTYYAMVKKLVR